MRNVRSAIACAAVAIAILAAPCAAATQGSMQTVTAHQVMATVHQFLDGFNRNDLKNAVTACAPQSSVIDDFPPHAWQGNGCAQWAESYAAFAKAQGATGGVVTIAPPTRLSVDGNTAYVVAPATFSYKLHGKPVTEPGATFTLALKRIGGNWKITAWAWAAH